MKKIISAALLSIVIQYSNAQSLPRKAFLGVRLETITEDARKIMELDFNNGVLISEVFSNSTAEAAGFKKGDILLAVDDKDMFTSREVVDYFGTKTTGEKFTWKIWRDKKTLKGKASFRSFPKEEYPGLEMIYTQAPTPLGDQRMIISKPEGGKRLPAILFIGGIGCYSLDFPFDSTVSEVQLLNNLSRNGYLCARAEKPGMGDNHKTKKCAEISFMEEMEGYVAMINTLKKRPDVDSNSIFIIGHSMGGVFAPLIAQRTKVKGVIAYGTIGSNFLEYLIKTRKTVAEAYEMSPEESDRFVKDCCECSVYYFADKMTTEEVEKKKPGCRDLVGIFDLRAREYNQELYDFNIPSLWKTFEGNALLLWGSADFIASKDDHKMIIDAVNYYHPGHAVFKTVENADHGMRMASNFVEAKNNPGVYNKAVSKTMLDWLNTTR